MLLIAVCDDNESDKNKIANTTEAYLQKHQLQGKVFAYHSAEKLLAAMEEKLKFDIILLDIILGEIDGMACARLIRQQDNLAKIAFLTSSTDYVYEGYEVNAVRYLLKPLNEDKITAFLAETIAQIETAVKDSITITSGGITKKIPISNILYLESKKNIVELVLTQADKKVSLYTTLDDFVEQHPSNLWIRAHKSFLVNFLYIEEYKNDQFMLQGGIVIPISRMYKSAARESFYALLQQL